MKMDEYVFKNIKRLETPVGYFNITEGGKEIPFSVRKNGFNIPAEIDDKGIEKLTTDTNYEIVISTKTIEVGRRYKVSFNGCKLKYCASDENTDCRTATINGWSVGLGMYDPNDSEWTEQYLYYLDYVKEIYPNREFICDKTKYKEYDINLSEDDSGYEFLLLDKSRNEIVFLAAWIKNEKYPQIEYEGALGFWLT